MLIERQTIRWYDHGDLFVVLRFSFNGKEKDDEVKGAGNSVDFGARVYDSRLGRFLSLDPLLRNFPSESNYTYAGNSPILMMDAEGKHKILYIVFFSDQGDSKIKLSDQKEIIKKAQQILNLNGIDVKVVGLLSDHALNMGLLDKTDNVTYVSNKEMFDKKGVPNTDIPQAGWRSHSGISNVNINWFNESGFIKYNIDDESYVLKLQKIFKEYRDNEAYMAIAAIHEGIGHKFQKGHEGPPNLMSDGDFIYKNIFPFPFETFSPFLFINHETKSEAQSYFGKPMVTWKGVPFKVEYYQSGVDNYTQRDENVTKIE
jgi:RHS repeat-associated protein